MTEQTLNPEGACGNRGCTITTMDDNAFLLALAADPVADAPRLVYADWLEEHGDPARAEYLRLGVMITERIRRGESYDDLRPRYQELCETLPRAWCERAGKRFDVVLEAVLSTGLIDMIGAVRMCTGWRLLEARRLVEQVVRTGPKPVMQGLLLEYAMQIQQGLATGPWRGGMEPLPPDKPRFRVALQECE